MFTKCSAIQAPNTPYSKALNKQQVKEMPSKPNDIYPRIFQRKEKI
jgi:hypothetical protein